MAKFHTVLLTLCVLHLFQLSIGNVMHCMLDQLSDI